MDRKYDFLIGNAILVLVWVKTTKIWRFYEVFDEKRKKIFALLMQISKVKSIFWNFLKNIWKKAVNLKICHGSPLYYPIRKTLANFWMKFERRKALSKLGQNNRFLLLRFGHVKQKYFFIFWKNRYFLKIQKNFELYLTQIGSANLRYPWNTMN